MDCAEEVAALRREVGRVVGGDGFLSFDLLNGHMTVKRGGGAFSSEDVVRAVARAGLHAVETEKGCGACFAETRWQRQGRFAFCLASGTFLVAGVVFDLMPGVPPIVIRGLYLLGVLLGAWFVLPKAWSSAKRMRPDMNLLMVIVVFGAIGIGEWSEAATVAFLFALALLLESRSVARARRAIRTLIDQTPLQARYICPHDGDILEKPVQEVPVGVTVLVRPGERVPLDGVVTAGETSINQAPITGESNPVAKRAGDEVYAGTVNNEGAFEFRATRPAADTTLARIVRMVEEAQARRAPSEQWVERFARYYTPAMMVLAVCAAAVPPLVFGAAWNDALYRALTLLVIACPCALVISTPVSILAGLAAAAHAGVLIKGGVYLEMPARLRAIAMDKTGTLTYGKPTVQRIVPLNGHTDKELLERAAAMEAHSNHPLARAIIRKAQEEGIAYAPASRYAEIHGKGASGEIGGRPFWVGSHRLLHETGLEHPNFHERANAFEDAGHSVLAVGNDDHVCGLISVADGVRPEAAETVQALRAIGIAHIALLTGDHEGTARGVAEACGIESWHAELLPQDKVRVIEAMRRRHGFVAMVGDGVNDAPAMAASSLGIAMGAAGSDAAIETADIALMSDDLAKLPWLVRHSRRTLATIRENVACSIGIKVLFIALAFAGVATLWGAIAADMGASLLVIFNSLRLLRGDA
ncbi:MAG TPA: heavy metal translocating P-type ATPase [Candidatus Hydrogenedentes bacterium]|nr:heavy metal translocating P-type ATPase [Candidatus Hydrogenedentota bacterium]